MQFAREYERDNEIIICCNSFWKKEYGFVLVVDGISIYLYAPLGAVLSRSIPRALATGMIIKPGDLTILRMTSLMYLTSEVDKSGKYIGEYQRRDAEVENYPKLYHPGEFIPNYQIVAPTSSKIEESEQNEITVLNVSNNSGEQFILDIVQPGSGRIYHYGGISWERGTNDHRDMVLFKDPVLENTYSQEG